MESKDSIIKRITSKQWVIFLLIIFVGISFTVIAEVIGEKPHSMAHHVFRDVGIGLIPIGLMSFIYEHILRVNFIKEMNNNIQSKIEEAMPPSLKDVRNSGIIDAYSYLKIDKLKYHLKKSHNSEIKILDIWFENLSHIDDLLLKVITTENCVVRVLLWDLKHEDVLIRRAMSIGKGKDEVFIMQSILGNLQLIKHLLTKIRELSSDGQFDGKLEVKLYKSFIGIALLGYGHEYYAGFYLRGNVSSLGTQLKVSGNHRFFYKQLDRHFESQWNDKSNVDFTENMYDEYHDWLDNYIINKAEAVRNLKRKEL